MLRSAISSTHFRIDNFLVGQHSLVTKLMKGILNSRPPKPRYSYTWDVNKVTAHLASLGSNSSLSLKQFSRKLVMLFALACPERTVSLARLDVSYCRVEGVENRKRGGPNQLAQAFLAHFPHNLKLCPVETFYHYLKKMRSARSTVPCCKLDPLFISCVKPHRANSSATIGRWLRPTIQDAGSARSASTTAAANGSVSLDEIMKMADWSCSSTFQTFYYKPAFDSKYYQTVLNQS